MRVTSPIWSGCLLKKWILADFFVKIVVITFSMFIVLVQAASTS